MIMDANIKFNGYHRPYSNFKIDRNVNKRIIVTEQQFDILREYLINESLSIADDVCHATFLLLDKIQNEYENDLNEGTFEFNFFGEAFNVVWHALQDGSKYNKASVNFKTKILEVWFNRDEKNKNLWNLSDSLQHEIEHIYQWIKKPSREMFSQRRGAVYDKVVELLPKYDENTVQYDILRAIYLSYPEEQDAFVNGLYSVLRKSKNKYHVSMIMSDSPLNSYKKNMLRINYNLNNNQNFVESKELEEVLNGINRNVKWLKKILQKGIVRLARKMAHIETKAIQELK